MDGCAGRILCPHAGECGGCSCQQLAYEAQLFEKASLVKSLFTAWGGAIRPIIGCESPWWYRNKMEFSFSQDRAGKRFLGLFCSHRRQKVVDLHCCLLANEWYVMALQDIRLWWEASGLRAYRPATNEGSLLTVTMREGMTSQDRMVIFTVSGNPDFAVRRSHLNGLIELLQKYRPAEPGQLSIVLCIRQIAKKMPTHIYEMILYGPDHIREVLDVSIGPCRYQLEFYISPRAFFQPNTRQAMKIYSEALTMADLGPGQLVWDLYCGIGVFGMFASLKTGRAIGVELSSESAYDAKTNADRLGLKGFSIHCGDTPELVAQLKGEVGEGRPALIVDPPRAGLLGGTIEEIDSLGAQTLVYVSCNPLTQARDVAGLVARGWAVSAIQPIDQFPHTAHLENIVVCSK